MWILLIFMAALLIYFFLIMPRISKRKILRQFMQTRFAHRGYHCIEKGIPENSMKAFEAAIEKGYGIELDVHLTKDGQLVVFHDDTLERICQSTAAVRSLTLDELRQFRLSGTKEQIPLFSDVLSLIHGQVPLLVELKLPDSSLEVCEAAYKLLAGYNGPYLVQSFNTLGIRWFKLHAPEVLRGQLSSRLTKDNLKETWILKFAVENLLANFLGRPDFISYKLSDLPKLSVTLLRAILKTPAAVWTLDTEQAINKGISMYDMQIFEKQWQNY